jgi:uncharacterized repeat protein (TIGR03803 family)
MHESKVVAPRSRWFVACAGLGLTVALCGTAWGAPTSERATRNPAVTVDYEQLHAFSSDEGSCPDGALLRASDGLLYGMTRRGGKHGAGTLFRLNAAGKVEVMHTFGLGAGEGRGANGSLIEVNGYLYGVTRRGGPSDDGVVFRLSLDGEFTLLHTFAGPVDGKWPQGPLLLASDGNLYGATWLGGTYDEGTVFRMDLKGNVTTLWHMNPRGMGDPASPGGGLIQAGDGRIIGTSAVGGSSFDGTVFAVGLDGSHEVLHDFDGPNGWDDYNGITQGMDGAFYGTTPSDSQTASGVAFKLQSDGGYTVLHYFSSDGTGLWSPYGSLAVWGKLGNVVVGTAAGGGAFNQGGIWRMTTDGKYEVLYDFGNNVQGGPDGNEPLAGLLRSGKWFYGTTCSGGLDNIGTVFRISWQ